MNIACLWGGGRIPVLQYQRDEADKKWLNASGRCAELLAQKGLIEGALRMTEFELNIERRKTA